MRKVILQEFVTIDGYAADEGGRLDFFASLTDEVDKDQLKFIETIDTILLGANTYHMVDEYQLYICPTVLGKGRALFSEETNMQDMQLLETKTYDGGMVFLRYKRKGQKMQS